jgi:hypothetical protein
LKDTSLNRNPFRLLGATVHDNRRRIVELAEQKALELDQDLCQKARLDLINPRSRLAVEMAWLPGVSPARVDQFIRLISENPQAIRSESGIPALAHANLMAAVFENMDWNASESDVAKFILEFAERVEFLDPEEILGDINEDRIVSGFPLIKDLDLMKAEFSERKRYYKSVIITMLNDMPPARLVDTVCKTVADTTNGDKALELINEVVDAYEVETQFFLEKEAENVSKLVEAVRELAEEGKTIIEPLIRRTEQVVRNWKKVAYPIQLRKKVEGLNHQASSELAYEIRELAVELYNEHEMIIPAMMITNFLVDLFSELPTVLERLQSDARDLNDIFLKTSGLDKSSLS